MIDEERETYTVTSRAMRATLRMTLRVHAELIHAVDLSAILCLFC